MRKNKNGWVWSLQSPNPQFSFEISKHHEEEIQQEWPLPEFNLKNFPFLGMDASGSPAVSADLDSSSESATPNDSDAEENDEWVMVSRP